MPATHIRETIIRSAKTVVVKIGTAVLTRSDGRLDRPLIGQLVGQIAALRERGLDVTVVSSGAVGAGMGVAGIRTRPRSVPMLQAVAAVGQPALMALFESAFKSHRLHAAQVLLTRGDFEDRTRYLNIRNTIAALHTLNAIPVINENDTVAVDGIRFGDNDLIAAYTANLLRADLMIILTVIDGLMDANGQLVQVIRNVDDNVMQLATSRRTQLGSGGMRTKLEAARIVTDAGEVALIANGRLRDVLLRLLDGEALGTLFVPSPRKLSARKRWIGLTVRPAGKVYIDAGAARALSRRGKSLLASGIVRVSGRFKRGDVIEVVDADGARIGRGLSNYDAADVNAVKGLRTTQFARVLGDKPYDEIVHRDNFVAAPVDSG